MQRSGGFKRQYLPIRMGCTEDQMDQQGASGFRLITFMYMIPSAVDLGTKRAQNAFPASGS